MTTPTAHPIPALDGTLGAIEIGLILGTFLFGMLTIQTFYYFRTYPEDSVYLRALVILIWSLELAHTICAWHGVYLITVTFYGQPRHIADPPSSLILTSLFSAILTMAVQTFFAFRVRTLSKRWSIPLVCCVFNTLALVLSIMPLPNLLANGYEALAAKDRSIVAAASAVVPAANIMIAISLCYYLWDTQRVQLEEGFGKFKQTRSIIITLMIWTAETTIITSLMSIMQLILFLVRTDLVWTTFFLLHAKLLSNCMLASLNGRRRLRSAIDIVNTGVLIESSEDPGSHNLTLIRMNHIPEPLDDGGSAKEVSVARKRDQDDSAIHV